MPLPARALRAFALQDDPSEGKGPRGRLLAAVAASGFTVEYILEPQKKLSAAAELARGDRFGLFLKPGADARTLFGLDREVLLWCSTFPTFQARDISDLTSAIDDHGVRLSRQFAILVTRYGVESRSNFEGEANLDTTLVHVTLESLVDDGLNATLANRLYARDLYDVAGAVVRSADFYGRRALLDSLIGEIETGTSQIGVFGLRKVGKTSLLNRLADRLRASPRCVVARLDLQWTTSVNASPEYTLWSLGESIFAAHRSIRAVKGLRLFGSSRVFYEVRSADVWEDFAHDIQLILEATSRRLCILVDEVERMFESTDKASFARFWRLLRGLDQQYPGRLRYVIGGTSPQCAEVGYLDGEDNPLFRYLRLEYLGPLSNEDAEALLRGLGAPMGLRFNDESVAQLISSTGGHPALLRTAGSVIHTHLVDTSVKRPALVEGSVAKAAAPAMLRRAAATLDQMVAALAASYEDENMLLDLLAQGQIHQFQEYAAVFSSEVEHLYLFGLVSDDGLPHLRVELLQAHLQVQRGQIDRDRPAPAAMPPGSIVGPYEVGALISSGGYCDVYEARDLSGTSVAVKILRGSQLSALQREVDILQELDHVGIVRIYDVLEAAPGTPCLVMELLRGPTLADLCNAAARPEGRDLVRLMREVLDALVYLHPKQSQVEALQSKEALSGAELAAWDRARHGYVHRDIKPENIMNVEGRGAVLIDFNISVRAGAPVHTVSATPGYGAAVLDRWSPLTDLHAFGVTFAELAAGARLASGATLEDLLMAAESRHGMRLRHILNACLSAHESPVTAEGIRASLLRLPQR